MRVTLAGTNAATTYDQILFTGTTAINGSLTVELANSFGGSLFIVDSVSIIIVVQQAGDLELITDGLESRQTAGS